MDELLKQCDAIDAAVFSGPALYEALPHEREAFKEYIARWLRQLAATEEEPLG